MMLRMVVLIILMMQTYTITSGTSVVLHEPRDDFKNAPLHVQ